MPSSYNPYRSVWTNDPLQDGDQPSPTKIRKKHVDELRESLDYNIVARGGGAPSWAESIEVDVTKIRATHLNELRSGVTTLVSRLSPCGTNTVVASYTAPDPMVAETNKVRAVHIQELRYLISSVETACYCDCVGHCSCVSHSYCSCAGMAHCCCEGHSL